MSHALPDIANQAYPVQMPAQALVLLQSCGAHTSSHSGRTLMDHLVGTYSLLKSWQAPEKVCLAGLFHSIYGTNAFHRQSLSESERPKVQASIGMEAEELAWLFCNVERPKAFLEAIQSNQLISRYSQLPLACNAEILSHLLEIECANLIEQGGRSQALQSIYCEAITHRSLISDVTYIATKRHLSKQAKPATPLIERATA
jgi:hypothetical protein